MAAREAYLTDPVTGTGTMEPWWSSKEDYTTVVQNDGTKRRVRWDEYFERDKKWREEAEAKEKKKQKKREAKETH